MKRRPLTKTHLLPLPAGLVRQQQLRHHVAWSLLLDQLAEPAQLAILLHVVEITYLLASPEEREVVSIARFRRAEAVLEVCFGQLDAGCVTIEATAHEAIEQILALHDQQLLSVPSHRYLEAHERVQQLAETGRSAIPEQAQ
ncbi:hypothetical protein KTD55_27125 [Burkholderia gladioli]|uniref:hypothetical protein n=1 Tax=Burkholderia gladioli TaxID=28095 RepID=UPI00163F21F9|nr:hypothetical protein [Burkholderia gladioli]MBU9217742.1 hypothetical protein [Burkholderia gladioli]MDN7728199.1 hypothetical protein [Burkholderia gladioli]